jgi:hypothetical protein
MMKQKLIPLLLSVAVVIVFTTCENSILEINNSEPTNFDISLRSVIVPSFNWETVNWMPTPPWQTNIPPPWIGQGSIASAYGIDVINDNKAADGWVLLYNTFSDTGPNLINPYFILYNKYRGYADISLCNHSICSYFFIFAGWYFHCFKSSNINT